MNCMKLYVCIIVEYYSDRFLRIIMIFETQKQSLQSAETSWNWHSFFSKSS